MKMSKLHMITIFTIIISIFYFSYSVSFAGIEEDAESAIRSVIGSTKISPYGDKGSYMIRIGELSKFSENNLTINDDGTITYTSYSSSGNESCTIRLTTKVTMDYSYTKEDGTKETINQTFSFNNLYKTEIGNQACVIIQGITDGGKQKVDIGNGQGLRDYEMVKITANGRSYLIPKELFLGSGTSVKIEYSITGPTGTTETGEIDPAYSPTVQTAGFNLWKWCIEQLDKLKNLGIDILSRIINRVVLAIGSGIKALINFCVGEDVTVGSIIYGKSERFTLDFWSADRHPTSVTYQMRNIVSQWYDYFRGFGITVYLIMLLYIGVRVLLASTGKGLDYAKEKLTAWIMGVILLFVGPFFMKYTIRINNSVVKLIEEKRNSGATTTTGGGTTGSTLSGAEKKDMMDEIFGQASSTNSFMLTVVYLIMIGQLIVLIGMYYKRAFMVSFLIIIYPIVATYYIWEKTQKGGARALENWTKEFTVLVFTQLVHAVVYAVLIEGMYDALITDDGGNYVLYILCVTFLFKAEGIVKQIFNVRSIAGTVGDLAQSGASAFAISKSVTSVFKKEPSGSSKEDEADEKDTSKQVNTLKNAHQSDTIRKQVESEEASKKKSDGDSKSQGSQAGGGAGAGAGGSDGSAPGGADGDTTPNGRPVVNPETLAAQTSGENEGENTQVNMNLPEGSGAPKPKYTTQENQKRVKAQGSDEMTDLEKARLVYRQKALKAKKGGAGRKIAKFTIRNLGRTAGIVAGLAVGAASGDMSKAVSTAANFGTVGAKLGNGVSRVADLGVGRVSGARMKKKAENGEYADDLRAAGVSEQFIEDTYNRAKGDAIKKALAKEMSGVRRGGKALGDVKFTGTMERETRS